MFSFCFWVLATGSNAQTTPFQGVHSCGHEGHRRYYELDI
jgi:hypothetical protein